MFYKPPRKLMHPEFRNGYRLGVEKGRRIERKLCLIVCIGGNLGWLILVWLISLKCS